MVQDGNVIGDVKSDSRLYDSRPRQAEVCTIIFFSDSNVRPFECPGNIIVGTGNY
jgi:hypothetical protein